MKITITTDRRPWANGVAHQAGASIDVSDGDGAALIAAGFATEDAPKRGRPRKDADA